MGLFSKKPNSSHTRGNQLQAIPYESAIARSPPRLGDYPYAGNGPAGFGRFHQRSNGHETNDERSAPGDGESAGSPVIPRSREKPFPLSQQVPARPVTRGRATGASPTISSLPERPVTRGRSAAASPTVSTFRDKSKPRATISHKPKITPRLIGITHGTSSESSLVSPSANLASPRLVPEFGNPREVSREGRRPSGHVDIADAVAHIYPLYADEIGKHRAAASGARNYGEDVADRNIASQASQASLRAGRSPVRKSPAEPRKQIAATRSYEQVKARPRSSTQPRTTRKQLDLVDDSDEDACRTGRPRYQNVPRHTARREQPATYIPTRGIISQPRRQDTMRDVSSRSLSRPRQSRLEQHELRDDYEFLTQESDQTPRRLTHIPPRRSSISAVSKSGSISSIASQDDPVQYSHPPMPDAQTIRDTIARTRSPADTLHSREKSQTASISAAAIHSRAQSSSRCVSRAESGTTAVDSEASDSRHIKHIAELRHDQDADILVPTSRLSVQNFDMEPTEKSNSSIRSANMSILSRGHSRPSSSTGTISIVEQNPLHRPLKSKHRYIVDDDMDYDIPLSPRVHRPSSSQASTARTSPLKTASITTHEADNSFRLSDYTDASSTGGGDLDTPIGGCEGDLLFHDTSYGSYGVLPGLTMDSMSMSMAPPPTSPGLIRSHLQNVRDKEMQLKQRLASLNIDLHDHELAK